MAASFTSLPILDLSLARSPETKPQFLDQLRHALFTTGFLYIKNTGIPSSLISEIISLAHKFFDLSDEQKLKIEMKHSPHFLGYSRLNNEITASKIDHREQIDIGSNVPAPLDEEPRYRRLRGPSQWPDEDALPGFRANYEDFIERMSSLSTEFTSYIAEAIGLPADAFEKFYTGDLDPIWTEKGLTPDQIALHRKRQDKLKIVKYPDLTTLGLPAGTEGQGVGPHKDSMLSSYLLQASDHRGLQVLNSKGVWVDAPPVDGTFVVAIGQGLEAMTSGVCVSTTHRVLSPAAGTGARYSVPFFQGVSYDAAFESMEVPQHVFDLKNEYLRKEREKGGEDEVGGAEGEKVEFTFKKEQFERLGQATLMNRVKSHPDVGEKWYPDLLEEWKRRGVVVGTAY